MKKKMLAWMLATTMVVSMCACGSEADKEVSESIPVESSKTESEKESKTEEPTEEVKDSLYPIVDEPITIKAVVVDKNKEVREDRLVWNTVAEVTGINIEFEVLDAGAIATYMASGDWADIIFYNLDTSMVNDYGVLGGKFVNYLDYIDVMPNLAATMEEYPITRGAATQINGEIYSLPCLEVSATVVSARPYVRTDVLENAGLEMPTTIEQFENCLRVLKEKNGEVSFVPNLGNDESYWGPMLFAAFGKLTNMNFDDDGTGKVIYNRTSEQMRLYFEWMNKLYEEELIHQEYLTMDGAVRKELSKNGKVAFIGGSEGNSLASEDFSDGIFHIDCCPALTSSYDDDPTILGASSFYNGGCYVNAESDYVEEIMRMLDITHAKEEVVEGTGLCGMSFCYGMEGQDWDYGAE